MHSLIVSLMWLIWCQAGNAADPLRYAFIVSQAELVGEAAEAAACSYSRKADLEGVGHISVGVSRADGLKCSRWALYARTLTLIQIP
jgi:hypothetical protein